MATPAKKSPEIPSSASGKNPVLAPAKESSKILLLSNDIRSWPTVSSIKESFENASLFNDRRLRASFSSTQEFSEILPSCTDRQLGKLALVQKSTEIPSTSVNKRPKTTFASFREFFDILSLDNVRSQGTTLTSVKEFSERPDRGLEPRVTSFQDSSVIRSVLKDKESGTALTSFKDISEIPLSCIDRRPGPTVTSVKESFKIPSSSTNKKLGKGLTTTTTTTIKDSSDIHLLLSDKDPETKLVPFEESFHVISSSSDRRPEPTMDSVRDSFETSDKRPAIFIPIKESSEIPTSCTHRRLGITLTPVKETSKISSSSTDKSSGAICAPLKEFFEILVSTGDGKPRTRLDPVKESSEIPSSASEKDPGTTATPVKESSEIPSSSSDKNLVLAQIKESSKVLLLSSDRGAWPTVGSIKESFEISSSFSDRKAEASLPPAQEFSKILSSSTDRQLGTVVLVQESSEIPSSVSDEKPRTLTPDRESAEIPSTSIVRRVGTTLASFKESSDSPSLENVRNQGTILTSVKESSKSPSSPDGRSEPRVTPCQCSSVKETGPGTPLVSFKSSSDRKLGSMVSLAKECFKIPLPTGKKPGPLFAAIKESPEAAFSSSDKGPEMALGSPKEISPPVNDRRLGPTMSSIKVSFNIPSSFRDSGPGITLASFKDTSKIPLSSSERRLGPTVASIKKVFETGKFVSFKEFFEVPSLISPTSQEDTKHRKSGGKKPSLPIYESVDLHGLELDPQGISAGLPPTSGSCMNDLLGSTTETPDSGLGPKRRPLPAPETLGCAPPKPPRPPAVSLLALRSMISASAPAQSGAAAEQNCLAPEKVQLSSLSKRVLKPTYPALVSNLNSCPASPTVRGSPPAGCPKSSQESEEVHHYEARIPFQKPSEDFISPCADKSASDIGIEVIAKPRKSFVHQGFSHEHASGNDKKKGKQPREGEVHQKDKDPNLKKINGAEGIPRKLQVKEDFRGKRNLLRLKPDAHGDEVYEDLYGGESGQAQTELEGKEKLKKLGRFFKKEKEKVKPKKMKKNFRI
ncbi:FYN-binding protein 2 isoform X2 [Antechinus flavipes]|uniref:FYN-binding protein 2 isoform X2 n=1 Tax=Antechinus flavipes TaxID=38775 RepID=UPI00223550C0|nr:FYN-binding protein 2 isoform X2 [Antechinus flavipes]